MKAKKLLPPRSPGRGETDRREEPMKAKKLLAYFLALVLVVSAMSIGVFAEGEEAPPSEFTAAEQPAGSLTAVSVSWDESPVAFTVSYSVRWDTETLRWDTDSELSGSVELVPGSNVKSFTLTNYSAEPLTAAVDFTLDEALGEPLRSAYTDFTLSGETALPKAETEEGASTTLTVTLNFALDGLSLSPNTEEGKLGCYTLSFTKAS